MQKKKKSKCMKNTTLKYELYTNINATTNLIEI